MPTQSETMKEFYALPFSPVNVTGNGPDIDTALRMAAASEYAAAQLGIIARAAEKIELHLAKMAAQ